MNLGQISHRSMDFLPMIFPLDHFEKDRIIRGGFKSIASNQSENQNFSEEEMKGRQSLFFLFGNEFQSADHVFTDDV